MILFLGVIHILRSNEFTVLFKIALSVHSAIASVSDDIRMLTFQFLTDDKLGFIFLLNEKLISVYC
ncbi:hypothetical protein CWC46_05485 [Prodigiosinella confusarubida]|uniref:Uncharacterized protein n=1 Tax=Serratia sp. (strain ATCC 39006) TaxID=104623 RepID=A0A2I5T425_SERS3|nr:hypothetical protein CWC46_05485 [Serratia sp. ATCC 39006]AUH03631.1 hypothetical protein Ser39006_005490 [Serratia sp. ATCC 39006]